MNETRETPQQRFLKRLEVLSNLCGFTLTKDAVALYDGGLRQLGYEKLCLSVEHVIKTRRSRDPFPSIADIAAFIVPVEDDQDVAIESANRIIQAISKHGWNDAVGAEAFIGDIGWLVVQRNGGWGTVCSMLEREVPTRRAQFRELALSLIRRHKAGTLDKAPSFAQIAPATSERITSLVGQVKSIGGTHGQVRERDASGIPEAPSGVGESHQRSAAQPGPLSGQPSRGARQQRDPGEEDGHPDSFCGVGAPEIPGQLHDRARR